MLEFSIEKVPLFFFFQLIHRSFFFKIEIKIDWSGTLAIVNLQLISFFCVLLFPSSRTPRNKCELWPRCRNTNGRHVTFWWGDEYTAVTVRPPVFQNINNCTSQSQVSQHHHIDYSFRAFMASNLFAPKYRMDLS